MALQVLRNVDEVNGEKLIHMDDLREKNPEKFTESGQMDWKWFESEIRPNNFIYLRHDKNSLTFNLQNGPIKEVGKNGCQVEDMIAVTKLILEKFQEKFPCVENQHTIESLALALNWQKTRTANREARKVEGTSQV